jgi:membrane protease YdiL (CAAX protease family)
VSAVVAGAAKLITPAATIGVQPVNALSLVLFVLVAGEELGWRGFALPRLLARSSPWTASVVLGVLWGFWHLPLFFVPGTPHSQMAFPGFIGYTVGLSLALTWFARLTAGSALLATLFHGVTNALGLTASGGVSPYTRSWIAGIAWLVAGALLLALRDRGPPRAAAIP